MEYGKRLNELREAKQLSIYKLSQDSGVSQGHISDLENGKYADDQKTADECPGRYLIRHTFTCE